MMSFNFPNLCAKIKTIIGLIKPRFPGDWFEAWSLLQMSFPVVVIPYGHNTF